MSQSMLHPILVADAIGDPAVDKLSLIASHQQIFCCPDVAGPFANGWVKLCNDKLTNHVLKTSLVAVVGLP